MQSECVRSRSYESINTKVTRVDDLEKLLHIQFVFLKKLFESSITNWDAVKTRTLLWLYRRQMFLPCVITFMYIDLKLGLFSRVGPVFIVVY